METYGHESLTNMKRLQLFPDTARIENDSLTIGGCDLNALADEFGTPLYLYDRATLETAVSTYRRALHDFYPGQDLLTYAGKAYLCLALAEWTQQHGLWVDCSGLGEISIAVAAGVKREHLLVHGVNKSAPDLESAIAHAGVIVVDNLAELEHLFHLARPGSLPDLWLRLQPGLAVETHTYTQTGGQDSKFGMVAEEIVLAANLCHKNGLTVKGLHFHLGSQFRDPSPLSAAIGKVLDLAVAIGLSQAWTLSPGGGWGVAYHEDDLPQPDVESYVRFIADAVKDGCQTRRLALPRLHLEPGRSMIARAGVALYRVGVVRQTAQRIWILLDGGLADNYRPALYGARYSALPVRQPDRQDVAPVWMAGPYCESADVLIEALPFPEVREGDLIAVPVSGAYQLSMSSNYNGARRPAVIWLESGRASLIQQRETPEDLYRRDRRLP
jgi:diaminopimelate decarboxylase